MRDKLRRTLLPPSRRFLLLLTALSFVRAQTPATPPYVSGNATWFTALGGPYGGCGVPQKNIASQNFIALNVFNTPHTYEDHKRPLPPDQKAITGMYNNGHNCGRWIRAKVGDLCSHGFNDGDPGKGFCRGGTWTPDDYNGATLDLVVADSCGDPNAWCRDDPFHIDIAQPALNRFIKGGKAVGDLLDHWNNRQVFWTFIKHPSYTGDIRIGFLRGSQLYWTAIAVTNLYNGIHGVQYQNGSTWTEAKMNADMGQSFIIEATTKGAKDYAIRVRDVDEKYVQNGRIYKFSLPDKCVGGGGCIDDYIETNYTVASADGSSSSRNSTTNTSTTPSTTSSNVTMQTHTDKGSQAATTPTGQPPGTVSQPSNTTNNTMPTADNATSVPTKRLCRKRSDLP